jgi:hypothetical protein
MAGAPSITPGIRQVYLVDPFTGNPDGETSASAVYFAAAQAVAVVAGQDIWEVTAGAKRVLIRGCLLNQFSDFGDAQAEILSVSIMRGIGAGSGGAPVTPQPAKSGGPAASATVVRNNTGAGAGGALILTDGWNVAAGWTYLPVKAERVDLQPGERASIRISVPVDSITVNQTLIIEEVAP